MYLCVSTRGVVNQNGLLTDFDSVRVCGLGNLLSPRSRSREDAICNALFAMVTPTRLAMIGQSNRRACGVSS